jgi:hypothetical protein
MTNTNTCEVKSIFKMFYFNYLLIIIRLVIIMPKMNKTLTTFIIFIIYLFFRIILLNGIIIYTFSYTHLLKTIMS